MQEESQYLNDNELANLSKSNVWIEGFQGLIKIDTRAVLAKGIKLRIGSSILGKSVISTKADIGLAGGAFIDRSNLGKSAVVTGGAKIFSSKCGEGLRNYSSTIRDSTVGHNFVIRSMGEIKDTVIGDSCKMKIFSKIYNSELGNNNILGAHSTLLHVVLGDQNNIQDYSKIEYAALGSNNKIGDYAHIYGSSEKKKTTIGDNCIIGDHVIIKPGVRIHSNTKIPDHSLVFIKDGRTVMGLFETKETR